MKATAVAPANIAFIKYWGKSDETLRIPLNDSISMNLTGAYTTTTVEFSSDYAKDSVELLGGDFSEKERQRVINGLDRLRAHVGSSIFARVVTQNSFPKGTGSAASASGFAALTVAGVAALGVSLPEKTLTEFARLGSGSACRSIPDGFVLWEKGNSSETSIARSLYPSTYWDICDLLVIVDRTMKKVPTTEGMEGITTSPYLPERLSAIPARMEKILRAFQEKDFALLGSVIEEDCLDMHHVMQSQTPPLFYWNPKTVQLMECVRNWRNEGIPVYFTIDAGPNVHILVETKDEEKIRTKLDGLTGIDTIISNAPSQGTILVNNHLF